MTLFLTFSGGLGRVIITAPFPASENADVPLMLVAETCANTDDPHGSEYGAYVNTVIETLQESIDRIVAVDPLQVALYSE